MGESSDIWFALDGEPGRALGTDLGGGSLGGGIGGGFLGHVEATLGRNVSAGRAGASEQCGEP